MTVLFLLQVSPELPPWHLSPLPKNNEASATSLNYTPGQPSPLDRIKYSQTHDKYRVFWR